MERRKDMGFSLLSMSMGEQGSGQSPPNAREPLEAWREWEGMHYLLSEAEGKDVLEKEEYWK